MEKDTDYRCHSCGRPIDRRAGLCIECEKRLMRLEHTKAQAERQSREARE